MNINDRELLLRSLSISLERLTGEQLLGSVLPALKQDECNHRVIAIGKSAASMACGAIDYLGAEKISRLLVITKSGHADSWRARLRHADIIESAHPVPDQRSLDAGQYLLDVIQRASNDPLLFLISGGASSLVEVLQPGLKLAGLQRINNWLQVSGMPIHAINAVRTRLSRIKGGKLRGFLNNQQGQAFLLSDVYGDDPAVIGSGLLCAPNLSIALPDDLPDWLLNLLPDTDESLSLASFPNYVIANLDTAREVAAQTIREAGFPVNVINNELSGSAEMSGIRVAEFLSHAAPGCYIQGGETTVELPSEPGRGGRNQQFALAVATQITGRCDIQLMAIGTDGDDGNTGDAGALVDGGTIDRGRDAGMDAFDCLRRADAGSFLEASGDLVTTGPTGTNLRDLVIALKR